MQIIPSIHPEIGQAEGKLKAEIAQKVDDGCAALYVWGVAGDKLTQLNRVDLIAEAVELTKKHNIPIGVGCHSLEVVKACEEQGIPCDFYVKTLHQDDYFTATPQPLRKEYIWLDGGEGWHDSMWCINPEETVAYMAKVKKPWVAFKVLAAGAILPRSGFAHALDNGADFLARGHVRLPDRRKLRGVQPAGKASKGAFAAVVRVELSGFRVRGLGVRDDAGITWMAVTRMIGRFSVRDAAVDFLEGARVEGGRPGSAEFLDPSGTVRGGGSPETRLGTIRRT